MIEYMKSHWLEIACVVGMAASLGYPMLSKSGSWLAGKLASLGTLAPGISFGRQENARDRLAKAAKEYRDELKAMGLPDELADQFALETVRGASK